MWGKSLKCGVLLISWVFYWRFLMTLRYEFIFEIRSINCLQDLCHVSTYLSFQLGHFLLQVPDSVRFIQVWPQFTFGQHFRVLKYSNIFRLIWYRSIGKCLTQLPWSPALRFLASAPPPSDSVRWTLSWHSWAHLSYEIPSQNICKKCVN